MIVVYAVAAVIRLTARLLMESPVTAVTLPEAIRQLLDPPSANGTGSDLRGGSRRTGTGGGGSGHSSARP